MDNTKILEMEVLINTSFGGFSLSGEVRELYYKKLQEKKYPEYQVGIYNMNKDYLFFFLIKNNSEIKEDMLTAPQNDFFDFLKHSDIIYIEEPERHDPILIEAVKELGLEKSSGISCRLAIQKINLGYYISSYDGKESVKPYCHLY